MNTQILRPPAFQRPSGMLLLGTNQLNMTNAGLDVDVLLDTIGSGFNDGIENVSTHRITPGAAGFYCVVGKVSFFNVINDKAYAADIFKNGSRIDNQIVHASDAAISSVRARCIIPSLYLTETDYLELVAASYAGVDTVDIFGNVAEHSTFLSVQRVR